jgi:hypothetical protein
MLSPVGFEAAQEANAMQSNATEMDFIMAIQV